MKKRLQAVKRILTVQEQLRRLAESKLGELERRQAALQNSRRDLVGALNEDTLLHGLFIDAMARRVRSISDDIALVEKAREAQAKRVLDVAGRQKRAERFAGTLDREYQTMQEKKDLAELIDQLKHPGASLP